MNVIEKLFSVVLNLKKNRPSYSQDGEDSVLYCLFDEMHSTNGFYVDIGAHHPFRYSNTYLFYQKGWTGINVDPTPGCMKLFQRIRSRDINLELGIGYLKSTMEFYCFDEPALNTFDPKIRAEREHQGFSVAKTISIPVITLSDLLDKYLPKNRGIDFITIDAEGMDLEILKSNKWNKFRPKLVLVEDMKFNFDQSNNSEINQFMKSIDYRLISKLQRTTIYKDLYAQ